jgi:hypothetical protein
VRLLRSQLREVFSQLQSAHGRLQPLFSQLHRARERLRSACGRPRSFQPARGWTGRLASQFLPSSHYPYHAHTQ